MHKDIKELAEKAGFVFWQDESWGPGEGRIDWSCNYDDEFDKFVFLLKEAIAKRCMEWFSGEDENSTFGGSVEREYFKAYDHAVLDCVTEVKIFGTDID